MLQILSDRVILSVMVQ